jgi:hypothetical protein
MTSVTLNAAKTEVRTRFDSFHHAKRFVGNGDASASESDVDVTEHRELGGRFFGGARQFVNAVEVIDDLN